MESFLSWPLVTAWPSWHLLLKTLNLHIFIKYMHALTTLSTTGQYKGTLKKKIGIKVNTCRIAMHSYIIK